MENTAFWIAILAVFLSLGAAAMARASRKKKTDRGGSAGSAGGSGGDSAGVPIIGGKGKYKFGGDESGDSGGGDGGGGGD